jgi:hypothetical protein
MARIQLESLTAGMKLVKPVVNLNGVLLLRAGEVLTPKHLDILKTWGVREADVVRADGTEPDLTSDGGVSPEAQSAAEREMAHRFRRVDTAKDPVMADILRAATRRLAVRLMTQPAAAATRQTP